MKRIVDVAREQPGFESASANGDLLTVVMATLDDVDALDDDLTAQVADDYEATGISYVTPEAVVGRDEGERLHTEVVSDLVDQDRWDRISLRADSSGTVLKLWLESEPSDLREIGAALADTGLAEEPMLVELGWADGDKRRDEASFGSAVRRSSQRCCGTTARMMPTRSATAGRRIRRMTQSDRRVLVTGGASGLGAALVESFVKRAVIGCW